MRWLRRNRERIRVRASTAVSGRTRVVVDEILILAVLQKCKI